MSKRVKYKPVKKGETIDISLALSQAIALIDQTAEYAITTADPELMLATADRWIAIGGMFAQSDESDDTINISDNVEQYGFGGGKEEVKDDE